MMYGIFSIAVNMTIEKTFRLFVLFAMSIPFGELKVRELADDVKVLFSIAK